MRVLFLASAAAGFFLLALIAGSANALSSTVCDSTGMSWVTSSPRLEVRERERRKFSSFVVVMVERGGKQLPRTLRGCANSLSLSLSLDLQHHHTQTNQTNQPLNTKTKKQGAFPHYQQIFYCSGNINIEGKPVDACVESGKACDGGAAAAGFCRHLGFDGAIPDQVSTSAENAGTPARSVTGEWCTGNGYDASLGALNREGFEKLVASYGKQQPSRPCAVLERVACYRSRESLSESWKAAGDKARAVAVEQSLPGPSVAPRVVPRGGGAALAANAPAPAPRSSDVSVSSAATSDAAVADAAAAASSSSSSSSTGGRRLLSA